MSPRTGNPALNAKTFEGFAPTDAGRMTINGTIWKTLALLVLLIAAGVLPWLAYTDQRNPDDVTVYLLVGGIGGLIVALVTVFKQHLAPITAPLYAVLEGLVLGGISAIFEEQYPGVVVEAIGLTLGVLFSMLVIYRTGLIKVTNNFRMMVVSATFGIMIVYGVTFLLDLLGIDAISGLIHGNGTWAIVFSVFVVGIAALNLVLDFDFIEKGAEAQAPKYMEWYGAFGLMVTLVWLYLEILRLLAMTRR